MDIHLKKIQIVKKKIIIWNGNLLGLFTKKEEEEPLLKWAATSSSRYGVSGRLLSSRLEMLTNDPSGVYIFKMSCGPASAALLNKPVDTHTHTQKNVLNSCFFF